MAIMPKAPDYAMGVPISNPRIQALHNSSTKPGSRVHRPFQLCTEEDAETTKSLSTVPESRAFNDAPATGFHHFLGDGFYVSLIFSHNMIISPKTACTVAYLIVWDPSYGSQVSNQ